MSPSSQSSTIDERDGNATHGTTAVGTGLTLVLVLGACGSGAASKARVAAARPDNGKRDAVAWTKEWARGDDSRDVSAGGAASEFKAAAGDSREYDDVAAPPLPSTVAAGENPSIDPAPSPPINTALSAGSTDDNDTWAEYLRYREQFRATGIEVHDVDVSTREVVHVVDANGKPVLGAHVELRGSDDNVLATRTTYADGRALFFPPKQSGQDAAPKYELRASIGDAHVDEDMNPESHDHTLTLDAPAAQADGVPLDVEFLIDATGSMGDEIEQLKANMVSVAKDIDKLSPRPDVRFAMTVFRDRGDEFVTRTFDFTADVDAFTTALQAVVANGGGDTPESVNAGLHDALAVPRWRGDDAIKLVFLVGDAAPHLDYSRRRRLRDRDGRRRAARDQDPPDRVERARRPG